MLGLFRVGYINFTKLVVRDQKGLFVIKRSLKVRSIESCQNVRCELLDTQTLLVQNCFSVNQRVRKLQRSRKSPIYHIFLTILEYNFVVGVRSSVTQSTAVVHGNSNGVIPSLDHVPPPCDDSEAGMSRTSHAMYDCAQEDLTHAGCESPKDQEPQDGNNETRYGIRIDNVPSQSVPDTATQLENNNTVIVNRGRTESATVVINNDGCELESPTASAIFVSNGLNTACINLTCSCCIKMFRVCANTKPAGPPARQCSRDCLSHHMFIFKKHHLVQCLVALRTVDSWMCQLLKCCCKEF